MDSQPQTLVNCGVKNVPQGFVGLRFQVGRRGAHLLKCCTVAEVEEFSHPNFNRGKQLG